MKRLLMISTLPVLALVAACGKGSDAGDIVTTNTGNVVLNDAQENYAFRGDNEAVSANMSDTVVANEAMVANAQ